MNVLQANHTAMVQQLEKEIYEKVGMTRSFYQPLVDRMDAFKHQINEIGSEIKGITKEHRLVTDQEIENAVRAELDSTFQRCVETAILYLIRCEIPTSFPLVGLN